MNEDEETVIQRYKQRNLQRPLSNRVILHQVGSTLLSVLTNVARRLQLVAKLKCNNYNLIVGVVNS